MTTQTVDFAFDFELARKSITETPSGDVIVEGWATTYDEDLMDEAFEPGCWEKGVRDWLHRNPQVLFQHSYDVPLGLVEDVRLEKKGMWIRARLDAPVPGSRADDIVRRVVRGSLRAFSIGGRWKRRADAFGRTRIYEAIPLEVSIASVPVNPFAVITSVAQKSFDNAQDPDLAQLRDTLDRLERDAAALRADAKAAGGTMRYATGFDLADPRDVHHRQVDPERRRRAQARNREESRRWEAERRDGPQGEPETATLAELLGVTKRETAEDLPATIPGEALDALLGRPPRYVHPGKSPEDHFREEAENRSRRERLLGGWDALAKRAKEREAAAREGKR